MLPPTQGQTFFLAQERLSICENEDFAGDLAREKWGKVGMLLGIPD
jgi:hypothetical protein